MQNNALFLNLSCIFCFVKWGGKWKKCQKKCKKSCFFLQHVPQKLKKYRFRHGLHLLLSRQKWKKTLKKTCFFHVFLHCFFAFCPDSRWKRTFGPPFKVHFTFKGGRGGIFHGVFNSLPPLGGANYYFTP